MKSKYDIDEKTPLPIVKKKLASSRREKRIYVTANIIRILQSRGCKHRLSAKEKEKLLYSLNELRKIKKQLASWIPIGYQIARFLSLIKLLFGPKDHQVRITKTDKKRIRRAAKLYSKTGDWHDQRQLRSLVLTAKSIGVKL